MRHPGRRVRGLAVRGGIGMTGLKHFLDLDRLDYSVLRDILNRAVALKLGGRQAGGAKPLAGKTLAMVFEKPSTRTRVSFEVGTKQLGGDTVIGAHSIVGANVWLMQAIPPHSIAYYKDTNLIVRLRKRNEAAVGSMIVAQDGGDFAI